MLFVEIRIFIFFLLGGEYKVYGNSVYVIHGKENGREVILVGYHDVLFY